MSLTHEFILLNITDEKKLEDFNFYLKLVKKENVKDVCTIMKIITLEDDFISYFYDTFLWIKSICPNNPSITFGINRHGITLLNKESYFTFYEIISGWIKLFSVAPEDINLKGDYCYKDINLGSYQIIPIKKNDILNKLNDLINIIEYLKEESYYIIHLGI